jgi:hypothetical protein
MATYCAWWEGSEVIYVRKPLKECWHHAACHPGTQEVVPGLFAYAGLGSGDLWTDEGRLRSMSETQARRLCKEKGLNFVWFDAFNYVVKTEKEHQDGQAARAR